MLKIGYTQEALLRLEKGVAESLRRQEKNASSFTQCLCGQSGRRAAKLVRQPMIILMHWWLLLAAVASRLWAVEKYRAQAVAFGGLVSPISMCRTIKS
jgi:hypothetical protein